MLLRTKVFWSAQDTSLRVSQEHAHKLTPDTHRAELTCNFSFKQGYTIGAFYQETDLHGTCLETHRI